MNNYLRRPFAFKRALYLFFLLFNFNIVLAQKIELSGKILDERTKEPVEYVLIINNKLSSVYSTDSSNIFRFEISSKNKDDTIIFHRVGYKDIYVSTDSLRKTSLILMRPEIFTTKDILVTGLTPIAIYKNMLNNLKKNYCTSSFFYGNAYYRHYSICNDSFIKEDNEIVFDLFTDRNSYSFDKVNYLFGRHTVSELKNFDIDLVSNIHQLTKQSIITDKKFLEKIVNKKKYIIKTLEEDTTIEQKFYTLRIYSIKEKNFYITFKIDKSDFGVHKISCELIPGKLANRKYAFLYPGIKKQESIFFRNEYEFKKFNNKYYLSKHLLKEYNLFYTDNDSIVRNKICNIAFIEPIDSPTLTEPNSFKYQGNQIMKGIFDKNNIDDKEHKFKDYDYSKIKTYFKEDYFPFGEFNKK
ncbi:MAG: hypothetical protein NTX03_09670 [Bacteroidetes bacterium]|nr:hypothetical protein [Bacteroidota bacterium]